MTFNRRDFCDTKILVTGASGFKGAWLSKILKMCGADIDGVSLVNPDDHLHPLLNQNTFTNFFNVDVASPELNEVLKKGSYDYVFHLAAEALVSTSYQNPVRAFQTNTMGTINILEALRKGLFSCPVMFVTTDKVYRSNQKKRPFVETDVLWAKEPYAASKVAMELAIQTYENCYQLSEVASMSITRAGNVVGGGDFSVDRLLPDVYKSLLTGKPLAIRNPQHTRPWQHVFDVCNAYLNLSAEQLSGHINGLSYWNVGPNDQKIWTVKDISELAREKSNNKLNITYHDSHQIIETDYLSLDPSKLIDQKIWLPRLTTSDAIGMTIDWYLRYMSGENINRFSEKEIQKFFNVS